jgi:hypothetical protein
MNLNHVRRRPVVTWSMAALILASVSFGCGGQKTAKISGKVLFQGRPLPGGLVTFYPMEGQSNPASAIIGEDGSYSVHNAPVGNVRITVSNLALKKGEVPPIGMNGAPATFTMASKEAIAKAREGKDIPHPKGSKILGTYVPIPASYANIKTTGLDYSVDDKNQDYDIVIR